MHSSIFSALIATAAGLWMVGAAAAGIAPDLSQFTTSIPTNQPKIVFIDGQIQEGDYRIFLEVVNSAKPDIIVLDSPGGVIDEAILIAGEIKRRNLNTFIYGNRTCASACTLMFLSGKTKYARPGASIGLHSAAYLDGSASIEGTAQMAGYLAEIGTPESVITRMANTSHLDMHWLTREEQLALRVHVISPGSLKVRKAVR